MTNNAKAAGTRPDGTPGAVLGWVALAFAAACPLPALAAGGHHAVDDAAILDAGFCKAEGWASRATDGTRGLHVGNGCRLGPVEMSIGFDRARGDEGTTRNAGLQLKWATEVAPGLSAGLSLAPGWSPGARPRERSTTLTGLLTGSVGETVRWHVNLGRALNNPGADETRGGISADWTFRPGWQVMAERYKQDGGHFARAGLRWQPADGWTLDLTRALRVAGAGAAATTLGFTFEFD